MLLNRGASKPTTSACAECYQICNPRYLAANMGKRFTFFRHTVGDCGCLSSLEPQREYKQADIGRDAQRGQHRDHIATGPELFAAQAIYAHFGEELFVACPPVSVVASNERRLHPCLQRQTYPVVA
jgi:hypothetical protein